MRKYHIENLPVLITYVKKLKNDFGSGDSLVRVSSEELLYKYTINFDTEDLEKDYLRDYAKAYIYISSNENENRFWDMKHKRIYFNKKGEPFIRLEKTRVYFLREGERLL